MFALCTSVTLRRLLARAKSNAKRTMRSDPKRVMIEIASAAFLVGSMKCSMPEYSPCVFSRTTTMSTFS